MHQSTRFPPADQADEDGLILVGGKLTPAWLLEAYRNGIFPWPILFNRVAILAWFSPDPRAIVEPDQLYVSRRLRRRVRSGEFQVSSDRAFDEVVQQCAAPRGPGGETWITPDMARAYWRLHELGHAHSIEVWEEQELVGGVYGVGVGGLFAGESMFFRRRDASKVALAHLCHHLCRRGYRLFDVQQATRHMLSMGAQPIARTDYLHRLAQCRDLPVSFGTPEEFRESTELFRSEL